MQKEDLVNLVKSQIRDVKDFPIEGIVFKDLTPVLSNAETSKYITQYLVETFKPLQLNAIAALESRGFWFGMTVAQALQIPFIPIRKKGKLPYTCFEQSYDLEYGQATIQMHTDALQKGWKVLIHDDLLATGGTAEAAAKLVLQAGAQVSAFSFLVELDFLKGKEVLEKYSPHVDSLIHY